MTSNNVNTADPRDPRAIDKLLDDAEVWAVVGLGGDRWRSAYGVAQDLQRHGKKVVPIHPRFADEDGEVLGEKGYATLREVPFPIDVVDVFRRSDAAGEFADQAVAIRAGAVWFQLGVVDEEAFARTTAAGVPMVMDVCPSREWHFRR